MTDERSISTSLLMRAQAREPEAWRRLTALFEPVVALWCRRAGLQPTDADDVTQEVFRSVAKSLAGFQRESERDTFRGWLYRITQNKIRDHWRRRAAQPAADGGSQALERLGELPADIDASASQLDAGEEQALLRRALELVRSEFQEKTWQAFWRVTVDQQPAADVAAALGMSSGAVYIAKSRVLARLREELAGLIALGE